MLVALQKQLLVHNVNNDVLMQVSALKARLLPAPVRCRAELEALAPVIANAKCSATLRVRCQLNSAAGGAVLKEAHLCLQDVREFVAALQPKASDVFQFSAQLRLQDWLMKHDSELMEEVDDITGIAPFGGPSIGARAVSLSARVVQVSST